MTFELQSNSDHLGLALALSAFLGLFVGSFLNVVIYRTPRHLSISKPRSFCPRCQRQLSAWENVPVVSWVVLRGRCRTCGEPISARYPLVEAGTACSFVLVTLAWHGSAPAIGYCVLAATILSVVLIDIGPLAAPLSVAAVGTAIGNAALIVASVWDHRWSTLWGAQIGVAIGAGCFAVLRRIDPECQRPQMFGRSTLIPAGCWLGGLGALSASIGFGLGGLVFMAWLGAAKLGADGPEGPRRELPGPVARSGIRRLVRRPLVVAVATGAAAGLLVFW
jgi:leader peptidase (prepilin peptidase)/N-methyltransferase